MSVYRGVVKGNTVVLEGPADLPDGTKVVMRPVTTIIPPAGEATEKEREEAFLRYLLEIGMICRIPSRTSHGSEAAWEPIEIEGPPLSETLI